MNGRGSHRIERAVQLRLLRLKEVQSGARVEQRGVKRAVLVEGGLIEVEWREVGCVRTVVVRNVAG